MIIRQLLLSATEQLNKLTDTPRLDAEVLLAHSLDKNRTWLATWPDKTLSNDQLQAFTRLLNKRMNGEPIAHITGIREFWSLKLQITPDTLIPRPDTELMVEQILSSTPAEHEISLLDLGTGSGAIALALATERPHWKITATDQSAAALEVARLNAKQLNISNIDFRSGNWFEPLHGHEFDIIASNPPYIPQHDPHLAQGDVRFEPLSALASGDDGLDDIRLICTQAKSYLHPAGKLFIEHGYDQKAEIFDIFNKNGYTHISQTLDLAENPRVTYGIKQ